MSINLPEGFLDAARWAELGELSEAALRHMILGGEIVELEGSALTTDQAVDALREFLARNEPALRRSGEDFLGDLARRLVQGDEPDVPLEEFEAKLGSLTDEQLVAVNAGEADEVEAMKREVIDQRRALVADALATGKQLLRGAVASGLLALLGVS